MAQCRRFLGVGPEWIRNPYGVNEGQSEKGTGVDMGPAHRKGKGRWAGQMLRMGASAGTAGSYGFRLVTC